MQTVMHTMDMARKIPVISIQISVTPSAKQAIDALAEQTDIPQKRVLSKLYEWFAELPSPAQKSILWPEETADEMDAIRVALEYLATRRKVVVNSGAGGSPQTPATNRLADLHNRATKGLADIQHKNPTKT